MGRKQIIRRYKKLVSEIEDSLMYDGRNFIDRYTCDRCGAVVYTTYKDKGVTPFCMKCNNCPGTMIHDETYDKTSFSSVEVVKNWYRPSLEKTLKMSDTMVEHVLLGGLILEG